ncbi:MAG: SCO family protein, partial [Hyphomicrobium sp.]
DAWGEDYLPDLPVVTQDGKTLRFYSDVIKGKITVISFIYTTCRDICPLVTARLADVQRRLGDAAGRDVFFVSISIDPKTDTPERLKQHADAFNAGPGWLFLTGDPGNIDIIRHKLGERSRKLTEHRSEVLLRNDRTGEWSKDSTFGDIETLANTIRAMDPQWQRTQTASTTASTSPASTTHVVPPNGGLPGRALFVKACASCHTVGKGDKVGPDLKGLAGRRSRDWLNAFLTAPEAMRAKGDPTALTLTQKFKGVAMPNLGLAANDIADILSYVEAETHAATLAAQDLAGTDGHAHTHNHEPEKSAPDAHAHHE